MYNKVAIKFKKKGISVAVDKMELLKRYKELKAQGISVSLTELKAQMETETKSSQEVQPMQPAQSAYASAKTDSSPGFVSSFNPAPTHSAAAISTTPQPSPSSSVQPAAQSISQPTQSWTPRPIQMQPQNLTPTTAPVLQSITPESQTDSPQHYCGNVTAAPQNTQQPAIKKYALIGYPLGHSLSKYIHNAGFKSLNINATYEILETPPESLVDRIKFFKSNNFAGFNVTIPLKLPVTMFLNEVDASADIVNAVNTVVINPETKELKGYNTDVLGFRNAIPEDIILAGKSCGVLGTGGAARAAITALAQSQVKSIKLFTRNIPNCLELLNFLRERFPNIEFNAFQIERIRDLSDIEFLVNTTPIGMQGRAADLTPVEEDQLRTLPSGAVVYDVIYNPKKTVLLKLAQKNGYRTINGVDMFIHQALAAQQIWTGRTPDFKDMKIAALENL